MERSPKVRVITRQHPDARHAVTHSVSVLASALTDRVLHLLQRDDSTDSGHVALVRELKNVREGGHL